ncbi:Hypothetical predicted protein [Mytilus galloprovincialis]|uniref:Uncharacterized protein n=1 Tax=Mytilus galloprovincialis TaxID=29158 RepID=A0A8B6C5X7_MYTGA|nr:Hypothetical predicted protein [Mytilus galloprovincialis]
MGAFEGLVELTDLNLGSNRLTSKSLPENIFQGLVSLQKLDTSTNYFYDNYPYFQSEISKVRSLVKLQIDLDRRHQIDKSLCNLLKLQDLGIFAPFGQIFSDNLFQNLKCLKIEILSLYVVSSLAPDTFISFPSLKTLRIMISHREAAYDAISSIFNSFKVFKGKNMTEISITQNPHRNGEKTHIKRSTGNDVYESFCLPKTLEELDLHSNVKEHTMKGIAHTTIINGSNLKTLKLANITFRDCDGTIFGIENLEYLDISGFICKVLSEHLLSQFPKLITLIARDASLGLGLNTLTDASEFLKMNLDLQHIDSDAKSHKFLTRWFISSSI